jgi:hypothetical protein
MMKSFRLSIEYERAGLYGKAAWHPKHHVSTACVSGRVLPMLSARPLTQAVLTFSTNLFGDISMRVTCRFRNQSLF